MHTILVFYPLSNPNQTDAYTIHSSNHLPDYLRDLRFEANCTYLTRRATNQPIVCLANFVWYTDFASQAGVKGYTLWAKDKEVLD